MKSKTTLLSENILISVAGHLGVLALLVTTVAFIANPVERIVAPDRVQIIEMDLSKVTITRDETLVYNTTAPKAPEKDKLVTPAKAGAEQKKPAPEIEETDWQAVKRDTPKPQSEEPTEKPKPEENKNAPVQKTTVRVNRETGSLNRTMTVSVIDALRMTMTRCWQFDRNRPDTLDIRAVAHLTMNQNGMVRDVWFEQASRADEDPAFAYILETIRMAISTCQPFRMLPISEYDAWKNIQLTFYTSNASVQ